jgi:hypothetical protein
LTVIRTDVVTRLSPGDVAGHSVRVSSMIQLTCQEIPLS